MVGFNDTDQYDNDTLDNWLMALGGKLGQRICGAHVSYDSTDSVVNVTNTMGGISPVGTRTSDGLYTLLYSPAQFVSTPAVFVLSLDKAVQVHCYYSDTEGCKIMTLAYAAGAWSLADKPFHVLVVGR